jgi:small subunit ribosomal protein S2
MGVMTVALIDTDSDPDTVDLPIPGNDDSLRSIELIVSKLADSVLEGKAAIPADQQNIAKPRPHVTGTGNGANTGAANPRPTAAVSQ